MCEHKTCSALELLHQTFALLALKHNFATITIGTMHRLLGVAHRVPGRRGEKIFFRPLRVRHTNPLHDDLESHFGRFGDNDGDDDGGGSSGGGGGGSSGGDDSPSSGGGGSASVAPSSDGRGSSSGAMCTINCVPSHLLFV